MTEKTGVYILEKGEESMLGRAWLAQQASSSIDIQYFIWSTDNIGILAAEILLRAADRGVTIRVLVGPAVLEMSANFNEFWDSFLAVPVEQLVSEMDQRSLQQQALQRYEELHAYASDPTNFEPEIRAAIENLSEKIPPLIRGMAWEDVHFKV